MENVSNIKILKDSKIKCQWCSGVERAEIWNDKTFSECTTREMRRAFKEIYRTSVWMKGSNHFYKCPNCGSWSRGSQLVLLNKSDEVVKGLGCESVLTIKNKIN